MQPAFLLIGLLSLGVGIVIGSTIRHHYNNLVKQVNEMAEHLNELDEQLAKRRHTYPTADGLEDAMAVAIELLLRYEATEKEQQAWTAYNQERLDQLREILGRVRAGPLDYDRERPNDRPLAPS